MIIFVLYMLKLEMNKTGETVLNYDFFIEKAFIWLFIKLKTIIVWFISSSTAIAKITSS